MTGLQKPPSQDRPSRVLVRFVMLVVLAALAGAVVYSFTINQRADLTESTRIIDVERPGAVEAAGVTLNLVVNEGGPVPVVFIHDVDVTGSLTLGDLAGAVPDRYTAARIDLPGFGLSDRVSAQSPLHTVTGSAEVISNVLEERFRAPIVLVGVGYGGEVAAEVALDRPDRVRGLVLIDTDFDEEESIETGLQTWPFIGKTAVYEWETGGRFAIDTWAPFCSDDGWCPTAEQLAARSSIITIQGTTDSLVAFRQTPSAAIAGANLDELPVPTALVWSRKGTVGGAVVEGYRSAIPELLVFESDTHQAHLEDYATVIEAIDAVSS